MFHSVLWLLACSGWLMDRRTDRFGFDAHQEQRPSREAAEESQSSGAQTVAGREQLLSEIRFADVMS